MQVSILSNIELVSNIRSLVSFLSLVNLICIWLGRWQVVESGGKNIEIAVMTKNEGLRLLKYTEVEDIVAGIEAEKTENSTFCREGLDIRVQ